MVAALQYIYYSTYTVPYCIWLGCHAKSASLFMHDGNSIAIETKVWTALHLGRWATAYLLMLLTGHTVVPLTCSKVPVQQAT